MSAPATPDANGSMNGPLFLGLDLSTQQLKAIVLDEDGSVQYETAVHFDRDLPKYGTTNGAIQGPGKGEVTSPVAMWVDALDLLLEHMKGGDVDFSRIHGVSGAGQQHGSVYWSAAGCTLLAEIETQRSLSEQLVPEAFSLQRSPIWQDSSTTAECKELDEAAGGQQALADLTGSRAYERFTGPQIARIRKRFLEAYEQTARISLVSSFLASLFLGRIAPIELSDASGMNLMNVLTGKWDDHLLLACGGPSLRSKLGEEPAPGGISLGTVSPWWVQRWGFNPDCIVAPFTGDNPASVVALSTLGDAVLSLGTSTTLLLVIPPSEDGTAPHRFTTSHLLAHPTTTGANIAMLCYKNGALAREQIRAQYADGHWHTFNELVEARPPGNDGYAGLYFPLPEIIPPGVQGTFLFKDSTLVQEDEFPTDAHARAILESQFLSIKSRIAAILPSHAPQRDLHRLILTGGSSQNAVFRQLAADLFGLPTYVAETKEAAGYGGALLALYAWWREKSGGNGTFENLKEQLAVHEEMQKVAEPNLEASDVYNKLVDAYREHEEAAIRLCAQSS